MNNPQSQREKHARPGIMTLVQSYFVRHIQVFFYSLGQLSRAPISTLMTCMVIGIALALPTGLHTLLKNAQQLSGGWESTAQISVFLKKSVTESHALKIKADIQRWPDVISVHYISREQALKEFQNLSGFGGALQALDTNPLPSVLVVKPQLSEQTNEQTTERLLNKLQSMQQTDKAQLDMQWVRRLYAIMNIVERGVQILGFLLALAVLLVVGNTIRLAIQNRRKEIVVMKLIGGTDAFIRRPFLYTGFWYGLFGGIISWLLVSFTMLSISSPIEKLTTLYQNQFELSNISFLTTLMLIIISVLLGLIGSWFAVGRHLREIEPQ
ncbi:MAG: permease-like cell division protein FtsX [Gammaproteobacteria bacterium]|nr:permease-like cell division protein FtsX [Gammaproteobacteria bacterium]MCW9030829.1 permease-like cell division protein FtsX [Gammaproteobacteria bacterium]